MSEKMIIKVHSCFSGRVDCSIHACPPSICLEKKKLSNVNQQAEEKTQFDRLSSEADWRCEAFLDFLEALSLKSPIWSTVPSIPSRPRVLLGSISL